MAPIPLASTVRKAIDEAEASREEDSIPIRVYGVDELDPSIRIFCIEDLFIDCIGHLFENIRKRKTSDDADLWISAACDNQSIYLRWANNKTKPGRVPEGQHGLQLLRRRLGSFGATLEIETRGLEPRLTFAVTTSFVVIKE